MSKIVKKSVQFGDHEITFETGKIAKQASGAVIVSCGGTSVLVTAQGGSEDKPWGGFLPLTVDYQEKMSAAGKIPGGYFKREGRLRESETLVSRMIDRSIRPLFTDGWGRETQVIATVFSADPEHPADALALTGASFALGISNLPFNGPIVGMRVAKINGELKLNPSNAVLADASLNIFMSCNENAVVMVEGGGAECSEKEVIDALEYAHNEAKALFAAQKEFIAEAGKEKVVVTPVAMPDGIAEEVAKLGTDKLVTALAVADKLERYAALDVVKHDIIDAMVAADSAMEEQRSFIKSAISDLKTSLVRNKTVNEKIRIDGRGLSDIRAIKVETGCFERTHGSAMFQRGETQALVTVTLGTKQDEQRIDDLFGDSFSNFMLHYNFPPYSVGEARFLRGPGRREIGHGVLARRGLEKMPELGDGFPYTVRIVSDITESNGSSSMATVCGGSLAMMDAGVPMKSPVAGIAMGLIKEGDDVAILSDILGDEDHLGDMDFKVTGTGDGITAIQMDIKIDGVTREIMEQALEQARIGRIHILGEMAKALPSTREEMSHFAPRITTVKVSQDKIRDIIGPGGKVIKDIVARTGCQVNIDDDGVVTVASADGESARRALQIIKDLTQEAEVGKLYMGNVRKITDFGAFVEIFPGTDGLVHISELADRRVKRVEDVLQEGDEVTVKCIGFDRGKIRLSRKQALLDDAAQESSSSAEATN